MSEPNCRLYLIAPHPLPPDFATMLERALAGGDVAAVRLDTAGAGEAADVLAPIRRVAHAQGVAVILADQPALAARAGCDGAHLQAGADAAAARRVLGDLQLGVWCGGSRDQAMEAGQAGADYVSFGPFFGPDGEAFPEAGAPGEDAAGGGLDDDAGEDAKTSTVPGATADLVSWWVSLMELPAVAEGGITVNNCGPLVQAGADFLAVGDAVWQHKDGPGAAVRAFNQAIRTHAPDV